MRFSSYAIFRIRSKACFNMVTLSSSRSKIGGSVVGGHGRNRGAIQISKAIRNDTMLAESHHWKYFIIHCFINVLLMMLGSNQDFAARFFALASGRTSS